MLRFPVCAEINGWSRIPLIVFAGQNPWLIASDMEITLLYFGRPREQLATSGETAELPADVATLAGLLAWLRTRGDNWASALADDRVRCAVNQELSNLSAIIRDGDEIAIFSPISGG